jgi:hypothetical protein
LLEQAVALTAAASAGTRVSGTARDLRRARDDFDFFLLEGIEKDASAS